MKRIFWFALLTVCLLAGLVGCGFERSDPPTVKATIERRPTNVSADWGITLSAKDITSTGLTLMIAQSGGEPTGELLYGSDYSLAVLEDGEWVDVPYVRRGTIGWTAEAYSVSMDGVVEKKINWKRLYGRLEAGTYRLTKGFIDYRGPGDRDTQSYSVEFEIESWLSWLL